MKIRDLMTRDVVTCTTETDLARVAQLMWDADCGTVPVVDPSGHVQGMVTDRDVCIGVATRQRPAGHIAVREVMSSPAHGCAPDDDVTTALETMRSHAVRRLPVIDNDGHIRGIVSMNDILLHAGGNGLSQPAILDTFKAICAHRHAAPLATA